MYGRVGNYEPTNKSPEHGPSEQNLKTLKGNLKFYQKAPPRIVETWGRRAVEAV